jgi:hypothetical protein
MPAPVLPEPAQDATSTPISSSRRQPIPSEAGQQRHLSLHAEVGWTRQECRVGLAAILAPTYRHTQRRIWRKKSPNREIVIAL